MVWQKFDLRVAFNILVVVYAFVLPLSRASVGIATALMILLFFFQSDLKLQLNQISKNATALSILLFVLFYYLTLLSVSGEDMMQGFKYLVPYLYLLPAVIMMGTMDKRTIPLVIVAFITGMFVSEIISYGIFFGLWEKSRVFSNNPTPFMHHIQYSTFLAFTALLLLHSILKEQRLVYRIFSFFFFLAVVATLFVINGRTGQVAFLGGLFLLGLTHFQNRLKALFLSSLLILLVVGTAYGLSDNFRVRVSVAQSDIHKMINEGNFGTSLGYRVGVTMLSIPLIEKNPLLGTGVVDTMPMIKVEAKKAFPNDYWLKRANHLQNQYLQVLVEIGFVGLGFLIWMLYKIARIPLRSNRYHTIKIILVGVYFFTMFFDIQLHIQFTAGLFTLIVGLLLAQSRIESEEESERSEENKKTEKVSYG